MGAAGPPHPARRRNAFHCWTLSAGRVRGPKARTSLSEAGPERSTGRRSSEATPWFGALSVTFQGTADLNFVAFVSRGVSLLSFLYFVVSFSAFLLHVATLCKIYDALQHVHKRYVSRVSHCVAQGGLVLGILLHHCLEGWDCRAGPLHRSTLVFFFF